jgi:high-affinity iron transporter
MLAALLIVFREVIEAGLVVGIVLAATKGVRRRGWWVGGGVAAGVIAACVVAGFAGQLAAAFAGSGQELFNAAILLTAVAMLTWHNVWMSSHGRAIAGQMRALGAAVAMGRRPLAALAVVVGVAVLREGAEVVLFLYGIAAQGGTSTATMLVGGALGVVAGAGVSGLMYGGLLVIPASRLFSVTCGLITLLAAGMASQAVAFLQQGGYAVVLSDPLWDSAWLLPNDSPMGSLLHALVGYTDTPTGMQAAIYLAVILIMSSLMRLVRSAPAAAGKGPSSEPSAKAAGTDL